MSPFALRDTVPHERSAPAISRVKLAKFSAKLVANFRQSLEGDFRAIFAAENRQKHLPPKLHRKFHHQTSLRGYGSCRAPREHKQRRNRQKMSKSCPKMATPRPAIGVSQALRARSGSGSVPETERVRVSCPTECPKSVPRVSPECRRGVPDTLRTLSGHFLDTPETLRGPGDTPWDTPGNTDPLSLRTLPETLRARRARETPIAGQGGRNPKNCVLDMLPTFLDIFRTCFVVALLFWAVQRFARYSCSLKGVLSSEIKCLNSPKKTFSTYQCTDVKGYERKTTACAPKSLPDVWEGLLHTVVAYNFGTLGSASASF